MIKLKNIAKENDRIICDAFVEDCDKPVRLSLNTKNAEFDKIVLPEDYEWCTSHINHAKRYLISLINEEIITSTEKCIMWY